MAAGGAIGAVGVFRILGKADSAGFQTMPWYQYLFTQFRVFFVYLKLFVFPSGQTIDYDFPISRTILDQGAIAGFFGILALIAAAVYFHRRYPLACFGLLAFAILLAPTSSVIPIKDPIAERRVYLPMIEDSPAGPTAPRFPFLAGQPPEIADELRRLWESRSERVAR